MKTKLIWVLAIVAIAFTACNEDQFGLDQLNEVENKSINMNNVEPEFTSDSTALTDAEATGILLMREEEKMAHDVYTYFFAMYDHKVFNQIASSEAKHTQTVGELIKYFGLEDPILDGEGNFTSTEIQDLYNDLIADGSESLVDALSTGALIEEVDIIDLVELIEGTTNTDLLTVYGNLLAGSENHLRAFVANLSAQGVEYTPQLLALNYYTEIIATTSDKGNKNGNNGTGNNDSATCDSTGVQNGNNQGQGNSGQQGNGNGQGKGNSNGNNQGSNGNQGNGSGNSVDADGDGLCDITGEPIGIGSEGENKGEGNGSTDYVDENGDGICDITGETIGDGESDGEGNNNSQSGTNSGNGNGNSNGNGK